HRPLPEGQDGRHRGTGRAPTRGTRVRLRHNLGDLLLLLLLRLVVRRWKELRPRSVAGRPRRGDQRGAGKQQCGADGAAPSQRTIGGPPGHQPSSWCSSTTKPMNAPTNAGSHAATTGCMSWALLKSSVIFDST